MRKTNFLLMMAMVILAAPSVAARAPYKLTDLGEGIAHSINNSGKVVGASGDRPVIFDSTGGYSNTYLSDEGVAYSVNNNGQIVGCSGDQATLFDTTCQGGNIYLGKGVAYSNNDSGQIAGGTSEAGAVIFDTTGAGNDVVLTRVGLYSSAYSINNNGQVVGRGRIPLHAVGAMLFDPIDRCMDGLGEYYTHEAEGAELRTSLAKYSQE